jgi:hypothetical protein
MTEPKPTWQSKEKYTIAVTCETCGAEIGRYDGEMLTVTGGALKVESVTGSCAGCGSYFYWSKFGRMA